MTVYAVWSGIYSDADIVYISTTAAGAEQFIQQMGKCLEDPRIREYQTDRYVDEFSRGLTLFSAEIRHTGEIEVDVRADTYYGSWEFVPQCGGHYEDYVLLRGDLWARDEEHAIKICAEKRAEQIALNRWPKVSSFNGFERRKLDV